MSALRTGLQIFVPEPSRRGYHISYRPGETNHCPGCSRSHWYVGRLSAECGFCGTALPLAGAGTIGAGMFRTSRTAPGIYSDAA